MRGERKTPFPVPAVAAALYRLGVGLRLQAYRRGWRPVRHLPGKVISVGNLTVGGTGKTPHVALIADYFHRRGRKVAILSRGYRGTETGSGAIISTPEKIVGTIEAGGEEPYWLAEHLPGVPVLVGKNRFRSGLIAGERFQSELIILDDGFQHLGLARRVNLLLLAAPHLFGNGRLLPAGTLREPAEEIRRANLVLITHAERMAEAGRPDLVSAVRALHPIVPLFFSGHEPWKLWDFPGRCPGPLAGLRDKPVLAFCGLAQPDSFRFSLESLGARVVRMVPFRDHHAYRPEDLERLARLAVSLRVEAVVTTEKDILKIGDWPTQAPPLQVLAVRAAIPDPAFWTCLEEILGGDPAQEGQI